jgi:hypothetical protein
MVIELNETFRPGYVRDGSAVLELEAGKELKIETTPDGEEVFAGEVPVGKMWRVRISLYIEEMDA